MEYPYFKGLEADRYSFYRVPKALVKADLFQKMSGDAKLLYAVLLDRMSLSIKNGWQDKHGNAYIICTIEEIMDSIHCARQKAVKLLDELEQEFRLIERRRQGLGRPNLLYVKDLYAGLSQSNYWKYENHTSGGMKNELPGVPKSNGSNTEKINKTDNNETDLIYPAELQEEEQYRRYFKDALELEILEQGYPADKAVLYEIPGTAGGNRHQQKEVPAHLWGRKAERGGEKPPDEAGFLAYPVHIGVLKRKQHSDSEHQAIPAGNTLQCTCDRG